MKFVQKSNIELSDTSISDQFILNYMISLEGIDVKLYLYLNVLSKKDMDIEKSELAKKMQITDQELNFSLERLQTEGLITKTSHGFNIVDLKEVAVNKSYIPKMETKTTRAQTEQERKRIAAATAINESFFQGMMTLMWYTDIETMFKSYMFSEEVMISLFHYCQERKALNRKYVHAVAESWYKGNVKTFEQLEEYLENYDNIQSIKQKIAKVLRITRNFTKYEEQYIDTWIKDFKYDFSMIEEALKRTVCQSNPSISYVNGILTNWYKKGYKKVDEITDEKKEKNSVDTSKSQDSKSKYKNYNQRKYEDLESFYDNM